MGLMTVVEKMTYQVFCKCGWFSIKTDDESLVRWLKESHQPDCSLTDPHSPAWGDVGGPP